MHRYTILFAFILSVFIVAKLSAQSLTMPLPKARLEQQLNTYTPETSRIKALMEIVRYYLDYANEIHNIDSAKYYYGLAKHYKSNNDAFVDDRMKILGTAINCTEHPTAAAKDAFLLLTKECHQKNDKTNEAYAWIEYAANIEPIPANDSIIAICYQHAIQLSKETNALQDAFKSQNLLARIHLRQQKKDLGVSEMLDIVNNSKANTENVLEAYSNLSDFYAGSGLLDKALYYGLRCERLMERSKDSLYALTYFGNLSNIYMMLGKYEESIYWSKRALYNAIAIHKYEFVYKILDAIVGGYIQITKPQEALDLISDVSKKCKPATLDDQRILNMDLGNVYMAISKFSLAEKYYLEMYRIGNLEPERDMPPDTRSIINFRLGSFYTVIAQHKKAKPFIDKAVEGFTKSGQVGFLSLAHNVAFKTDSALGLYPSAIVHLEKSQQLHDTIFNASRNKQIEELQIAYQTEKKEKDIALLKGHEKQQSIKLLHAENARNLIIIGSCLLAIIIALLIWQNRTRKKNNQIITQKNGHLEQLISEKDWLLKEVHHRVKNNLHTVICLLESQANYLESDALKAIETSQHRIYAMSLIHQKLYQSDDIKTIDMQDYIGELVRYLKESFGPIENIVITCAVPSVKLGVSHAIPLGLIINEAVTNAIQHAFPGNISGKVHIKLNRSGDDITMIIEDDGVGIGYDVYETETESLGIELIKGLTKELKGSIHFEEDNGTKIIISFSLDPLEKMISQNEPKEVWA